MTGENKLGEDFTVLASYARERARQGKSLTGRQANALLVERDFTMRIGMGFFHTLTTLRAFVDPNAPQWVKDELKKTTDYNKPALEACQKLMLEISEGAK